MRKTLSAFRLLIAALFALTLFGLQTYGQERELAREHGKDVTSRPNGIIQDWTRRHLVYPRVGPINTLIALQKDPRAILSWQAAIREDWHRYRGFPSFGHNHTSIHRDWSISLGAGTVAPAMYPAKYTFDPNDVPVCATDFVVFPINAPGSATQPTIVAFNNLYSGTAPGPTGMCNRPTPPPGDDGVSATTLWSYNIEGIAGSGQVATSPVLSLDGSRVAFVETGAGAAHFHVLAPRDGDGIDTTTPNAQNVLLPVTITSGFATLAPVAGSGTVTDLALGSSSDTLSSPFIDYNNDLAYIGNDTGTLFRVMNVFCASNACQGGGRPAPSLDPTWGTGGALATGCTGVLTGAVRDSNTGNIFVGCSDGNLYGFTASGATTTNPILAVGNGTPTGGIVDPPVIDVVNGFAYVVSGNSSSGFSVLVQAKTDTSSATLAALGVGGAFNLHAPAFNDAYFSAAFATVPNVEGATAPGTVTSTGNTSNWQIYDWSDSGVAGSPATLVGVGFDSSHVMTAGIASNFLNITGSAAIEFSPVTEFLNGSTDQIFTGGLFAGSPNFIEYNVTDFPSLFPNTLFPVNSSNAAGASATGGSGSSGIVVDNNSSDPQASSVYFGALGVNTAVKLTQSGLN